MRVHELIAALERFEPDAEVRLSVRGFQVPRPYVGVGLDPQKELVLVIADRDGFAGRLPDLLLERPR